MAFFDKFKKSEKGAQAPAKSVTQKAAPKTIREELEAVESKKTVKASAAGSASVHSHRVLLHPIVSEKSAHLSTHNQYVFKVAIDANKIMIKKAIKETYNAEPLEVNIIRTSGKTIMRGRVKGVRQSFKKAIVTMPKGVTLTVHEGV